MTQNKIGRYQLKRELGRGGMAVVYVAEDPHFEREVAVKVLPAYFVHEADFHGRFEREAKTIASLEHHAIVPVYDYGEAESPFLVMRYMRGGTLSDKLKAGGPLLLEDAIRILERVADALDTAHRKDLVHRDLKPDNILFDEHGKAYLSDFGVVKIAQASTAFTKTGGILGTPAYMSPEQATGTGIDWRTDVYALGAVLYEMLTGDTPYRADTPVGLIMKHVTEPVPRLPADLDVPPGCEAVIQRAMAKQKEQRYPSASALVQALKAAAIGRVVAAMGDPQAASDDETVIEPRPVLAPDLEWPLAFTAAPTIANQAGERETQNLATQNPAPQNLAAPIPVTQTEGAGGQPSRGRPVAAAVTPLARQRGFPLKAWQIVTAVVLLVAIITMAALVQTGRTNAANMAATETAVFIAQATAVLATATVEAGATATQAFVIQLTENASLSLTPNAMPTATFTPTLAPTPLGGGGLIAFDSDRDGQAASAGELVQRKIYLITSNGFQLTRLSGFVESDGDPDWSPDGAQIVFESRRDGNPEIYVMNADGSNPRRLTHDDANDWAPVWSPDGAKIAFASMRMGNSEIFTMDVDGNNLAQITSLQTVDATFPSWSPDGSRIAFEVLVRERVREIFIVDATGENLTQITNDGVINRHVSWSPDGSKLAFATNRDGNLEIYVMDVDGANPVRLTQNDAIDWMPVWSPDGAKIAYVSQVDGNSEIYLVNIDGSGAVNVTNHPGEDLYPSWQPLGAATP
jgi:Tol biopolymer transport system component